MKIQFVFESLMCTYGSDLVLRNLILDRWPHLKEHMEALKNYEKCLPQLVVKIPFYETNDAELVRWMELTFWDDLIYGLPKFVDDTGLKFLIEYF